jgi:hypothetical protein
MTGDLLYQLRMAVAHDGGMSVFARNKAVRILSRADLHLELRPSVYWRVSHRSSIPESGVARYVRGVRA